MVRPRIAWFRYRMDRLLQRGNYSSVVLILPEDGYFRSREFTGYHDALDGERQPMSEPFQQYANDPKLSGASPDVDGGPMKRRNRASLAPRAFHQNTTDKTLDWKLTQALSGLGALLEDTDESD